MINFQDQVIARSHEIPVLVDFWAPWCGPCRVLGPVLEQLAQEQSTRWELVKINTEEQPELAREYGIRSIPNVKLFYQGKVINEFSGAMVKFQVQQWLDANIPDPSDIELKAIISGSGAKTSDQIILQLENFLLDHPNNNKAKVALTRKIVFHRFDDASKVVADIPEDDASFEDAEDIRLLTVLMQFENKENSRVEKHLAAARQALEQQDFGPAIEKIIEATVTDKSYMEGLPRRAAIALFHLWGPKHPLTQEYQRRFSMALY